MLSKFFLEIVLEKKKIEKKGRNSSRTFPLSPLGPASLWPVYSSTPGLLARPISARPTRAPFLSLCVDDERAPFLLSPPSRPRAPASPLPFPSSSPPRRELGSFLPEINPNPRDFLALFVDSNLYKGLKPRRTPFLAHRDANTIPWPPDGAPLDLAANQASPARREPSPLALGQRKVAR